MSIAELHFADVSEVQMLVILGWIVVGERNVGSSWRLSLAIGHRTLASVVGSSVGSLIELMIASFFAVGCCSCRSMIRDG